MIKHWTSHDIERALPMTVVIAAMREAFAAISDGRARAPQRHNIALSDESSRFLVMPSYMTGSQYACVKIVSICPHNSALGKPTIIGTLQAFDARTGELVATFDAESITALRTGAASALATDLLAPFAANRLAIFGCGAQAYKQVEAINIVRPLSQLMVFGRDPQRVSSFVAYWQRHLAISVTVAQLTDLKQADIIATATTSATPLFSPNDIAPGVHINAVGSYSTTRSELPPALLGQATVAVDSRDACSHEAGEIVQAIKQGHLRSTSALWELGELMTNRVTDRRPITIFKSVGHAMQDLICIRYLLGDITL